MCILPDGRAVEEWEYYREWHRKARAAEREVTDAGHRRLRYSVTTFLRIVIPL